MSSIIKVTDLSKSFLISHEGTESYTALRDEIAQKVKRIFSFLKIFFKQNKLNRRILGIEKCKF
ncbi:MAG: hypothetical protein V9E88_15105 [Ferruginibacter sp.]